MSKEENKEIRKGKVEFKGYYELILYFIYLIQIINIYQNKAVEAPVIQDTWGMMSVILILITQKIIFFLPIAIIMGIILRIMSSYFIKSEQIEKLAQSTFGVNTGIFITMNIVIYLLIK